MISIAENLFKEFTADGQSDEPVERMRLAVQRVERLLTESPRAVETQWLEFKSGHAMRTGDWKELWSEALGAFANAGGGVVIWGVFAGRDNGEKVDAVKNFQYVPHVAEFQTILKMAAHTNTDPPLPGIRFFPILKDNAKTDGFLICY